MFNPLDLSGKTVLVTGASSGIGRGTAVYLSRLGAKVLIVGRDEARLEGTLGQLEGTGHRSIPFDLNQVEQIPSWIKGIATKEGPLYGVVHSAGISMSLPLQVLSYQNLADMQRINVDAAILLAKGFRQRGVSEPTGSSMVLLASVAAIKGKPALVGYSGTKGAVVALTRALALELAGQKIRVNCVSPGLVESAMIDDARASMPADSWDALVKMYPLGVGVPDDVAYAVAWLLAPGARWITGTNVVVDGGLTA